MSLNFVLTFSSCLILSFITSHHCAPGSGVAKYAVLIDAGSSGTRVWVYWWRPNHASVLPDYQKLESAKNKPGLSSFADDEHLIDSKISELIDKAEEVVPKSEHSKTPIYVFATAGMRFLSEEKAKKTIQFVDGILKNKGKNPFLYESPHNARILSGEEEGVFAWLAVNYLTGAIKNPDKQSSTSGILELGGASTQITFESKGNILADKFPVKLGSRTYSLYAHSYLNFGQDAVDQWLREYLSNSSNTNQINHPCLLEGDTETVQPQDFFDTGDPVDAAIRRPLSFIGTGSPHDCVHILGHLVNKVNPRFCYPKPCAVGSVYQPSINTEQTFYAMSVFPLIFKDLNIADESNVTPATIYEKSDEYCKKNITELRRVTPEKRWKFISKSCSIGIFTALLLTKGYGFKNESKQIIGSDVINNVTADWTLGALIYEQAGSTCPKILPQSSAGRSLRPPTIFISASQLPVHLHSFMPFLKTTFSPTGSQSAIAILIYLVLGSIFKRLQLV